MKAKKITIAMAVFSALTAAAFSYEAKAKITFDGNLVKESQVKGSNAEYSFFSLNPSGRGDNGIELDLRGALAGGHFELFYSLEGGSKAEDGWNVSAGNTHLWFKPIDELTVKLGYVGNKTFFTEREYGKKVGNPFMLASRGVPGGVPEYITNCDVNEMGFALSYQPIYELTLSAAIAPGIGASGMTASSSGFNYGSYGVSAQYVLDNFTFQLSYADNGNGSWKVIRLGAGYEDDYVYAFIQPVLALTPVSSGVQLDGFCIDSYGEFLIDELKLSCHLPVTVRLTSDPSYMEYFVKAAYNFGPVGLMDDVTPYLSAESNSALKFNSDFGNSFNMSAKAGVEFSIGSVNINTGACLNVNAEDSTEEKLTWSVPFKVQLLF